MGLIQMGPPAGDMMIAWPSEHKGALFAKHPSTSLALNAQLVLDPDEAAVFFSMGSMAGMLGAGRHTLNPNGAPFLRQLAAPGNPNALEAELFFVSSRPAPGQQFGGPAGSVTDRGGQSGQLQLFGSYTLRISNPGQLISELVGMGSAEPSAMLQFCGQKIKQRVGDCVAEWVTGGFFDLSQLAGVGPQVAAAVTPRLAEDFANLGITIQSVDQVQVATR